MHAQLYMRYDANWTKDGDSTSRIADLNKSMDWDSEMYARSERGGAKSELGERISPQGERSEQCVKVEQDEETGRDKVHDGEVLDNSTLEVHRVTETVLVTSVHHGVIGPHANLRLLESILRPAVAGLIYLWGHAAKRAKLRAIRTRGAGGPGIKIKN
ncbi:MAG: hypothetical protein Q9178_006694 [Gyalolechia marmorata]